MDQNEAAEIWARGEIIEKNDEPHRIWPSTIDGRWLYPGEMVIELDGKRYVADFPREAKGKDL